MIWIALTLSACLGTDLTLAPPARPPGYVHEPLESYESRDVHGFTVMLSTAARAHPETTDPALELLDAELQEIVEVVPEPALDILRRQRVWIEHENPDRPCACYHVSPGWLAANGYIVEKAQSVEVSNTRNFVAWIERTQPMMVLHEMAHGYHDIVFGYGDEAISACFRAAQESGLYDAIPYVHGGMKRHYALTNPMEYFAELSESYFGRNDFFPYTREELKRHDPLGYALVERAWSLGADTIDAVEHDDAPWFDVEAAREAAKIDLLIVAPNSFVEELKPFVEHKNSAMRTGIAALESILAETGGADDPERLKRFLFGQWKSRGVRYVLLVGDADVLPVRYMVLDRITEPAFDYAFYPSDLYYADLAEADGSFENWNGAESDFHGHYFGEVRGEKNKSDPINFDQIDYRPDVAVGRWPVSTPEEVAIVVSKSVAYEVAVAREAHPGAGRSAFVACGGWIENRGMMDRIASPLAVGWSVEKRYFADAARNDETPPPDAGEVVALMNGSAAMIFHSGHGSDNDWHGSLSVRDLDRLDNAACPPILMSAGCSTARFATLPPYEAYKDVDGVEHEGTDKGEVFASPPPPPAPYQRGRFNPTGLGEQLLRAGPNGAVAYIGCNTGSQPCGMTLMEGFVAALANAEDAGFRLGDAWSAAVAHYYDAENLDSIEPTESWYPASIFFQGMKFMFFGDPSLPLPGSKRPTSSN